MPSTPVLRVALLVFLPAMLLALSLGCGGSNSLVLVVASLEDAMESTDGKLTLRKAIADVPDGGTIMFDASLNGGEIELTTVGQRHSLLRGEVFTMSGMPPKWAFEGYLERDYGRSALYAAKDLTIDASALPLGITLSWEGTEPARVLAVLGDLTLKNLTIRGGRAENEAIEGGTQPFTLGRGGAVACWGKAVLHNCVMHDNHAVGDTIASRDRGAFGGAIYGDLLELYDCVISGNSVIGYGAAGGGVYSVGGTAGEGGSVIHRCSISGNCAMGQHTYGGGVYTDGGGPGNDRRLEIYDSTIACNEVNDAPDIAQSPQAQYYYRGGAVYMSNGSLTIFGCTIFGNEVHGWAAEFSGRPNMGGGGIAATIGDAHTVEQMRIGHSIIVGNSVGENDGASRDDDVFTGSLMNLASRGYNRIGILDFSRILVPVPEWDSISRRHWPKTGDDSGFEADGVLNLAGIVRHPGIVSVGADEGSFAVLYCPPSGTALNVIPHEPYAIQYAVASYNVAQSGTDNFIMYVLSKLRADYGDILGEDFGLEFGDLTGVTFHGPDVTWASNAENEPWITFWHDLDTALDGRLGVAGLNDEFFGTIPATIPGGDVFYDLQQVPVADITHSALDMLGASRSQYTAADIGAVEVDD